VSDTDPELSGLTNRRQNTSEIKQNCFSDLGGATLTCKERVDIESAQRLDNHLLGYILGPYNSQTKK